MDVTKWTRGQVLGRGSTATVSLASDLSSGEFFAVKSSELSRSDFLQRERRIHSLIRSPFVISYLGFGVSDDRYNLFLEYAPGGSVHDEVKRRGPLPESATRPLVKGVVSGLADLHSAGVAHCDVKPQNILIGRGGGAKVADLGCARLVGRDGGAEGKFMGTPMFMAPEVARGEEQGTAADIWAVGCTVIEMATGRPPWPDATDAAALLHRVGLTGDLPETPACLSAEGKDFLGKCLARDAKDRWTADQLLRHPFVSDCCVSDSDSGCNSKWTSPKSTLDRGFWDSFSEEEEEEGGGGGGEEEEEKTDPTRSAPNAISDLFGGGGGGGGGPNWVWDDDWLTVRIEENDDEAELITPAGNSGTAMANSPISTSISGGELLYSTNHMITGHANCDNCDVVFSDNCGNIVTELWSSNWTLTLTSSCHFAFVLCPLVCCAVSSALIVGLRPVNFFVRS